MPNRTSSARILSGTHNLNKPLFSTLDIPGGSIVYRRSSPVVFQPAGSCR